MKFQQIHFTIPPNCDRDCPLVSLMKIFCYSLFVHFFTGFSVVIQDGLALRLRVLNLEG